MTTNLKRIDWAALSDSERDQALMRPAVAAGAEITAQVAALIASA